MTKPLILYHANCADGFCACWVASLFLGDDAEFIPVQYGQEPPKQAKDREIYIVDFSYKRPVVLDLIEKNERVIILDHHKTAEAELASIQASTFPKSKPYIHFDMTKSGARLTWEYFSTKESPWLVDYTEDRDLWKWRLPRSKEIFAFIGSYSWSFELWSKWDRMKPDDLAWAYAADEGAAIIRYQTKVIEEHVKRAQEIKIGKHYILAANATTLFSEIAGELAKGRPFGACYFDRADGKRQWSLRSVDLDVSEIAKQFGGGGHRNAAGFEESVRKIIV